MKTNNLGIEIIKHYESLHDGDLSLIGLQPKMCPAGIWTEGYGRAMMYKGEFLRGKENKALAYKLHTINNEADAIKALFEDLSRREPAVSSMVTYRNLNENQFSALVSFIYNLGAGALQKSSLLKYLNLGKVEDAAFEFLKWNKSKVDGKLVALDGLTSRRKAEKELFLKQV